MTFVSPPLEVPDSADPDVSRVDLQVFGVGHREASYEVRVFLDEPGANADTTTDADQGYAGSYFVFGHGGCVGDAQHCHVPEGTTHRYDVRPRHKLTPQTRIVKVTDAWKRLNKSSAGGEDESLPTVQVTLVPVNGVDPKGRRLDDSSGLLVLERIALVAYA
jgi:hypothetical protein